MVSRKQQQQQQQQQQTNKSRVLGRLTGLVAAAALTTLAPSSLAFHSSCYLPLSHHYSTQQLLVASSASSPPALSSPTFATTTTTRLQVKPSKKTKSASKSKTGSGGGFGASSSSSSPRADLNTKTRSVSGNTSSPRKILASAANNFDIIRKKYGKDATTDVYVRSPLNDESTFWFVGKVVRVIHDAQDSDDENSNTDASSSTSNDNDGNLTGTVYPTQEEAIVSQKRLILEYSKNQLRPQNMGGPFSSALELWMAPGDSEMDVVKNLVSLVKVEGSSTDLREGFHVKDVGYNPEIYVGDEKVKGGLRVVRDLEGKPVKPVFDIN